MFEASKRWYIVQALYYYTLTISTFPVHRSEYCWTEGDKGATEEFGIHILKTTVDHNINLPLFTVGYIAGLGIETIYLIVFWQAATCVYHGARTAWILAYDRPASAQSA